MRISRTLFVSAFVLAPAASCSNNHSVLELHSHPAGMGGVGGAGASGNGGSGGALTRPPAAGAAGVSQDKPMEAPGRSVFTVVHGIVDADATAWCFARVRNGVTTLVGDPVPAGGLAYGQSLSFETLPGVASDTDGFVPYVIAGDLSAIDGLDCATAVARARAVMAADTGDAGAAGEGGVGGAAENGGQSSTAGASPTSEGGAAGEGGVPAATLERDQVTSALPPSLRVGALPGLPVGTLSAGYSMIEVADGCLGAREFTAPRELLACGDDYTPEHGSLSAEIATLSRLTTDGMLSLQALHASRGSGDLGVGSVPGPLDGGVAITIVDNFGEGALKPRDPRTALPAGSWGVNLDWTANASIGSIDYASEAWSVIRDRANISELEDGRGYTLIPIGPSVNIDDVGFWHDFAFALVDNDPSVN